MLQFDKQTGWVLSFIFAQGGWTVCFGGFKTVNGKLRLSSQGFTKNLKALGSAIFCYQFKVQ